MSEITRRDALSRLAVTLAAAGVLDVVSAREAHALVLQAGRPGDLYVPKALSAHQFRTLEQMTDLIIPVEDGRPGALGAAVPAWIDTLCSVNGDLRNRYVTGLGWIDQVMRTRHATTFVEAQPAQRTALLDQIAFRKNASSDLSDGIEFFALVRRMTVDGFYASPVGMRDIYLGTMARPEFTVPRASLDYVLSRSPFRE